MNSNTIFDSSFLLKWNQASKTITRERSPAIPVPVANLSGGRIGDFIYAAASTEGNQQKYFWRLNLNDPQNWETLPVWEGAARTHAKFLKLAEKQIPNLAGINYTYSDIMDFQNCRAYKKGKYQ